ncbi:MAG: hypothetical protein FJ280_11080 [Planctomycetes bacterium]|nr:hypothetical protein [Planctomycetota bacterium]
MWNFFEQPWTLLGASVLVLMGVLTFRSVWSEKRRPWQWLLPAGVAVLGLGLDLGVTTDLEKIHGLIRTGMKAVEAEDCAALARIIASDYQDSYHQSKESLMSHCRSRLTPPAVRRLRRVSTDVKLAAPDATTTLAIWIMFDKDSYWAQSYKPTALVLVEFYLRKQPNKAWLVRRIEVREVDKMPVTWGMT